MTLESGPYKVTVLEPCGHCEGGGEVWGEDEHGQPDEPGLKSSCGRCGGEGARVVSVKAFETLGERDGDTGVRPYLRRFLIRRRSEGYRSRPSYSRAAWTPAYAWAATATFDGTAISLPDGREIMVEQTRRAALAEAARRAGHDVWVASSSQSEILAFNAVMAERYAQEEVRGS